MRDRVLAWIELIRPGLSRQNIAQRFFSSGLIPSAALKLCEKLNARSEEEKRIGVELILKGAFSYSEMRDPNSILDYFDRPDWNEVVEKWRGSTTREIRHIVKKRGSATVSGVTPIEAPKVTVEKRQDPKEAIRQSLSGKLKGQAANVEEALKVLAKDPTMPLTATDISAAVERNRRSCGASFPEHVVRKVLPILVQNGLIQRTENGAYRHKPSSSNA